MNTRLRPRMWRWVSTLVVAAVIAAPAPVLAQGGFLWQGVANVEGWRTDSASMLLARGGGRPALLGRLDTWGAIEPIRNIIVFAELLGEAGAARSEPENEIYLKQAGIKYSPSDEFTVEAGRVTQIVGVFPGRQLSTRNPLIGAPDGYAATYPDGIRVDGSYRIIDYRAGVVSLPLWRDGYTPEPKAAFRPAIGLGVTPTVGVRFGLSATIGPYLNDSYTSSQLRGSDWSAFRQKILAFDAQFSRGYFEAHAEAAHSRYDIPGRTTTQDGFQYYVESKYTFTPRLFVAARYERNDYPFIEAFGPVWVANNSIVTDGEIGAGLRLAANTLAKLSFRKDYWTPNSNPQAPHDNGYALVFQLSQSFDVIELFTRAK